MTPAAVRTEAAMTPRFPGIRFGRYSRRRISGSNDWSQHAFGNALDLFPPTSFGTPGVGDTVPIAYTAWLNRVAVWVGDNHPQLGIKGMLWQVTNHFNHVHIDFWSHGIGNPARVQAGMATFQMRSGRSLKIAQPSAPPEGTFTGFDDSTLVPPPLPPEEDELAFLSEEAQKWLEEEFKASQALKKTDGSPDPASPTSFPNLLKEYRERRRLTGIPNATPEQVAKATMED